MRIDKKKYNGGNAPSDPPCARRIAAKISEARCARCRSVSIQCAAGSSSLLPDLLLALEAECEVVDSALGSRDDAYDDDDDHCVDSGAGKFSGMAKSSMTDSSSRKSLCQNQKNFMHAHAIVSNFEYRFVLKIEVQSVVTHVGDATWREFFLHKCDLFAQVLKWQRTRCFISINCTFISTSASASYANVFKCTYGRL
jgi:hypothetical protein